jgi:hypothetical protein
MYSWVQWLSYLFGAFLGFIFVGMVGGFLGEFMKKHRILETADRDYWPKVLGGIFSFGGIGVGVLVVWLIFGS